MGVYLVMVEGWGQGWADIRILKFIVITAANDVGRYLQEKYDLYVGDKSKCPAASINSSQ